MHVKGIHPAKTEAEVVHIIERLGKERAPGKIIELSFVLKVSMENFETRKGKTLSNMGAKWATAMPQ